MPKIIEIRKCLFKLQLNMSGVFFETHCRTLFCVNIYGSYKVSKTVRFFWPTLYICKVYGINV